MQAFTASREAKTPDELWLTEHPPVFTLGQANKQPAFLLEPNIEVVKTDRGGKVTFHGPGQLVGYTLVDLKRAQMTVHTFVHLLEQTMIDVLGEYSVHASRMDGHPGIYVEGLKIGSLGLRVRRRCTYHGISLNVNMDLTPFDRIDPCGIRGMAVTQLKAFVPNISVNDVAEVFERRFRLLWKKR